MRILAISGSTRQQSTNTALLRAMCAIAPRDLTVDVFAGTGALPVFSPDLEGTAEPTPVRGFKQAIADSDGLLISSPEYVHSIPGGLKNAIDWLVSGDLLIGKPIALVHASHRGDDMLAELRKVLATVSTGFDPGLFYRLPVSRESPQAILAKLSAPEHRSPALKFLTDFAEVCRQAATRQTQ